LQLFKVFNRVNQPHWKNNLCISLFSKIQTELIVPFKFVFINNYFTGEEPTPAITDGSADASIK